MVLCVLSSPNFTVNKVANRRNAAIDAAMAMIDAGGLKLAAGSQLE